MKNSTVVDTLKRLAGKAVEALPAIVRSVVGSILSFLSEAVGFSNSLALETVIPFNSSFVSPYPCKTDCMLSSLLEHQTCVFLRLYFKVLADFKCLPYKAAFVLFYSSVKFPKCIK